MQYMATLAEKQAVTAKVLVPRKVEQGISLMIKCSSKNEELNGISGIAHINFKDYDEANRKWIKPSQDTLDTAKKRVELFGADWHNGDVDKIAAELIGKSAPMYATADRISFSPIAPYVKFSQLQRQDTQILKKMDSAPLSFVGEWKDHRFNLGFKLATADGTEKNVRVSQVIAVNPDDPNDVSYLSLKYDNAEIAGYQDDLANGNVADDVKPAVKKALSGLLQQARDTKIAELDDQVFGEGVFEKLLNGGDLSDWVVSDFDPQSFDSDNGIRYYVTAVVRRKTDND